MDPDLADEADVGAYTIPAPPPAHRPIVDAFLRRAARVGAASGLFAGLLGGLPYVVRYARADDAGAWAERSAVFVGWVVGSGSCLSVGGAVGMRLADRALQQLPLRSLRRSLGVFWGAAIGAALLGVIPGALGSAYFGTQQSPFMGTGILVVPFAGSFLTSVALARADGESGRPVAWRTPLLSALLATLVFGGAGVTVHALLDDDVLLQLLAAAVRALGRHDYLAGLLRLGSLLGALLGLSLGGHFGATVVLARMLAKRDRPRSSPR